MATDDATRAIDSLVVNVEDAPPQGDEADSPWNGSWRVLTPAVGTFEPRDYMHGEPAEPMVFRLWSEHPDTSEDS